MENKRVIYLSIWESQYYYVYFIPENYLSEIHFMYTCWNYKRISNFDIFLWNGKDKVIHLSTYAPYEFGGLDTIQHFSFLNYCAISQAFWNDVIYNIVRKLSRCRYLLLSDVIIGFSREEMDLENYVLLLWKKIISGIVDAMTISHQLRISTKLKKKQYDMFRFPSLPSREGGSVGHAKKGTTTRWVLSASEGRAAKYERLVMWFFRS